VTFVEEWQEVPLLNAQWSYSSCPNCTAFDGLFNISSAETMITVESVSSYTVFAETVKISADDRRSGDRFGYTVALDGDQLAGNVNIFYYTNTFADSIHSGRYTLICCHYDDVEL
jgi:hypothetical protein